ncbi:MAG: hypothetical protein V1917_01020 [Candidatus Gottesmanbacteria bacterium]
MEWISVIVLSILASLAASTTYLSFVFHTPPQTVNLGVTHYWEDYMYYLSQFTQGARGAWLNHAMFTEEGVAPTLLHYPNILLGKIGGIIHLNPMDSYNISIIVLSCIFLIFTYYCLKKLFPKPIYAFPAFLFFLFSASFMNRLPDGALYRFYPYQLWNTPHYMFDRIGTLPHYLVINILILLSLVFLFTRHTKIWITILTVCVFCMVTILQPVAITLIIGTYWLTSVVWKDNKDWKKVGFLTVGYLFGTLYLTFLYFTNHYVNSMASEAQWQVRTIFPFLMKSIGPILPFAVLGIVFRWKKTTSIERFGMILIPGAYLTFLLPVSGHFGISNARLLFSAQYLFWGWFAAVGLFELAERLKHVVRYKKNTIIGLLFFVFFISVAPTIVWELQQKIPPATTYTDPLYFLPKSISNAFTYLSTQKPLSSLVLANPSSRMDMLVPVLGGHRTITGPQYATQNLPEKKAEVIKFFALEMEENETRRWLQSHHINFVLFTVYDGDRNAFQRTYPFLVPLFSSKTATVYGIN